MLVHISSKTVDMNTQGFKPDGEMNAAMLLQASPSRRSTRRQQDRVSGHHGP